jgi:hypothetical protein
MSTIKNLVKTFKERERQTDVKITEDAASKVEVDPLQTIEPKIVSEIKPVTEIKTETTKDKTIKQKHKVEKQTNVNKRQKPLETANRVLSNFSLSDDFFASLNEQTFSYEKSKFAYIDKKIYEVLMTLKRKKDVKNISSLINAALSQFIEQNKDDIKAIFMDDLL